MDLKRYIVVIMLSLVGTTGFAKKYVRCSKMDLKAAPLETVCVTRKKGLFMRVESNGILGIKDLQENGRIWFDPIARGANQFKAEKICLVKNQRLPTKEQFRLAEKRGLREAFGRDMRRKYFWTSTVLKDPEYARVYLGSVGRLVFDVRKSCYATDAVRCVEDIDEVSAL